MTRGLYDVTDTRLTPNIFQTLLSPGPSLFQALIKLWGPSLSISWINVIWSDQFLFAQNVSAIQSDQPAEYATRRRGSAPVRKASPGPRVTGARRVIIRVAHRSRPVSVRITRRLSEWHRRRKIQSFINSPSVAEFIWHCIDMCLKNHTIQRKIN